MGAEVVADMSSPSSSPVLIVLAAFAVTISSAKPLQNISIYRLTPINYTGVTNMDTGDAAGDVMFGLNQMLLPQLCPMEPDFTWCANRQYLSGGGAHMVYTQFTVESDARFGEYNACNPNADTGIFECETYSSNAQVPHLQHSCRTDRGTGRMLCCVLCSCWSMLWMDAQRCKG